MNYYEILSDNKLTTPHKRAEFIAFLASLVALIYHFCLIGAFYVLKLRFMFLYNIISSACFLAIVLIVPKVKQFIIPYTITVIEVITHQLLAEYFLGTAAAFHFFILLMGLIPFLVFESRYLLAIPFTFVTGIIFIVLEASDFKGVFQCQNREQIVEIFRILNVSIASATIIVLILLYTYIAFASERLLNRMNKRLNSEIEMAAAIQKSFFHTEKTEFKGWQIETYNKAMSGVSGDFIDVYSKNNELSGCSLMDVSGHGISSGLVTMLVKNIITKEFNNNPDEDLGFIADKINSRVIAEKGSIDNYMTGILLRTEKKAVELVNAGHPFPLLFKKSSLTIEEVKRPEKALGVIGLSNVPSVYFSQKIPMESGDELLLFTDGISEAQNKNRQQYRIEQLCKSFMSSIAMPLSEQVSSIIKDVSDFTENTEFDDDVSLVILKKL